MSEFGLELPPTTKLGSNGKGGKAYVVKESSMATILGIVAVLLLLSGALFLDIRSERTSFAADLSLQHKVGDHQRMGKLEAETKLQEVAAELSEQVGKEMEEESDLKIMAQHIQYVQHAVKLNIHNSIDDADLTVADIKKIVDEQFEAMTNQVGEILHDHLILVKDANKKSQAAMDEIQASITAEFEAQEKEDQHLKEEIDAAHTKSHTPKDGPTLEGAEKQRVESHIQMIFDHVYTLAEKMGDADIDNLLKPDTVKTWEQLLSDTEEGKVTYDDAVSKMEDIITKDPAALKLAEAAGAFDIIHADGGKKGVTEVTNFRTLLKHVKWLPQYSSVLQTLAQWKDNMRTTQQVLVWIQEQVQDGKLDQRWISEAIATPTSETASTAAKPAATTTTTTHTGTATATATASAAYAASRSHVPVGAGQHSL